MQFKVLCHSPTTLTEVFQIAFRWRRVRSIPRLLKIGLQSNLYAILGISLSQNIPLHTQSWPGPGMVLLESSPVLPPEPLGDGVYDEDTQAP